MSDWKEQGLKPSPSAKSKTTPEPSFDGTGLMSQSTEILDNSQKSNSEQMELFPMSFAEDIPANRSASQAVKEAKKTKDISGLKCIDLYESVGLDGSFPRMLVDTLNSVSTRYSLHWKLKDTPSGRLLFQRALSMPRTKETGSGLLHTPTAKGNQMAPSMNSGWLWGTPAAGDAVGSTGGGQGKSLRTDVRNHPGELWPTPDTRGYTNKGSLEMLSLKATSRDEWSRMAYRVGSGVKNKMWPTPAHRDFKGMSGKGRQARKGNPEDTLPNAAGGSLNPTWVEWLMGFPLGHTELKDWVTRSSRKSRK